MGSPDSTFCAGDVVGTKYRLVERLGAGGMGEVWSAEHVALGSRVAVKLLRAGAIDGDGGAARFEREARAAASLASPNVVRVFDHGFERGVPFIVMEKLEGETLAARLRRLGALDFRDVVRVVSDVARALAKAHDAGIVHRDVKPENVFLVHDDDGETTKLLDFGVAKVTPEIAARGAPARTRSGALVGTPMYMSPEQLRGRVVDARSDLWSLALVAFECITGEAAFSGETVAELCAEILSGKLPVPSAVAPVPAGFDAWFARAASRDRADRFASARELAESLASLAREPVVGARIADEGPSAERASRADSPLGGESATTLPTPLGPERRGPRGAWMVGAAALVALGAAVLLLAGRGLESAPAGLRTPAGAAAVEPSSSAAADTSARPADPSGSTSASPAASSFAPAASDAPASRSDPRRPASARSAGAPVASAPSAGPSAGAPAKSSAVPPNPLAF